MRTARLWLSRDPLPDAERSQGPNLYEYVKNNPVDLTDPLGLCPCGQHLGFVFSIFADTVDTMTGGKAMASLFPQDAGSSITVGPVDGAGALNKALTYAPGLAKDAATVDPVITLYGVAVDLGAFAGSWRCVPN